VFHRRMRHVLVRVTMLHQERMIERERIARELHDTLLQGVQGLILRFQATVLGMRADDPVRGEIEGTLVRANRILEEGRDKVMGLRSVTDCNLQLEQAWSELAVELGSSQEPAFELTVEGTPRELMPLIRDEVHRIGAEAIINAFRHAQARRIDVEIGYAPMELHVRIRDDGRGIPEAVLDAGRRSGHWGLPGMSERATWMHARLMVWSKPAVGTEIELRVPGSVAYGVSSSGFFGRLPIAFRGWPIARKGAS
jgi:signal transduction histidine kinase